MGPASRHLQRASAKVPSLESEKPVSKLKCVYYEEKFTSQENELFLDLSEQTIHGNRVTEIGTRIRMIPYQAKPFQGVALSLASLG